MELGESKFIVNEAVKGLTKHGLGFTNKEASKRQDS